MAIKKMMLVKRSAAKTSTMEVDIAQEFKDVKQEFRDGLSRLDAKLDGFKNEISAWKSIFDTKLTQLNTNMEKVLGQIADHEGRITKLELESLRSETKKETISEMSKLMWFIAKGLIGAGIVIGSILGTAQAWKLLFPS